MRKIRESDKIRKGRKEPIADKSSDTAFAEKRSGLKDRRKIHTFIANDRRSGIADRRQKD
jgi:hypothetical protein